MQLNNAYWSLLSKLIFSSLARFMDLPVLPLHSGSPQQNQNEIKSLNAVLCMFQARMAVRLMIPQVCRSSQRYPLPASGISRTLGNAFLYTKSGGVNENCGLHHRKNCYTEHSHTNVRNVCFGRYYFSTEAKTVPLKREDIAQSTVTDTPKSWKMLYDANKGIQDARRTQLLAITQLFGFCGFVSLVSYIDGPLSIKFVSVIAVGGFTGYILRRAQQARRNILRAYIDDKGENVKLSFVNGKGKRVDVFKKLTDIVPFSDTNMDYDKPHLKVETYQNEQYFLVKKYMVEEDQHKLSKIFGKIDKIW